MVHGGVVDGRPVDACHVCAMGLSAAVLSGACNAVWLQKLEETWPGTSMGAVTRKSLADICLCAPPVLTGYLVCVPLLTSLFGGVGLEAGGGLHAALGGWTQEGFASAMLLNLCTFLPYNLAQFSLIAPPLRPLGGAMVSATSAVVLSGITLGYTIQDVL